MVLIVICILPLGFYDHYVEFRAVCVHMESCECTDSFNRRLCVLLFEVNKTVTRVTDWCYYPCCSWASTTHGLTGLTSAIILVLTPDQSMLGIGFSHCFLLVAESFLLVNTKFKYHVYHSTVVFQWICECWKSWNKITIKYSGLVYPLSGYTPLGIDLTFLLLSQKMQQYNHIRYHGHIASSASVVSIPNSDIPVPL